jgi:hypothetical protein
VVACRGPETPAPPAPSPRWGGMDGMTGPAADGD